MKCPTCNKELTIDPAGSFVWPCSTCQYAWGNSEIKAYWKGFDEGRKNKVNRPDAVCCECGTPSPQGEITLCTACFYK